MHTELYTWLPFHLPDQREKSYSALEREDKDECNGEGEGHTPALRV